MLKKYSDEENLIYNRFDLIYPENYKECVYRYSYEIFILHYHLEGNFAMIDVWARGIPQAVFERFVEDIFENNPDVVYIRVDGSLNNYHERLQMIRNVYIELPDRNNRIDDRLSLKTLRSIQRKERRLAEKYGDISTKVYKDQIPIEVVNKYFEWKRISHRAEYHLTAVEYIKRYHVTHALELLGGNRSIAVVFCCIVGKTAYLENLSYDNDASKYSAGLIGYKYMLEYLSDIGIRRFYLGREGQDYKNHFGSIKQDAFWGNIISERAIERVKKQLIHIECRKVAIYGLGNVGREFLRYSDYLDAKVVFAIDRNIKSCDQLNVYGPDDNFPLCDLVIITMEKKNKEVEANLERRGLKYLYWRELLKGGTE